MYGPSSTQRAGPYNRIHQSKDKKPGFCGSNALESRGVPTKRVAVEGSMGIASFAGTKKRGEETHGTCTTQGRDCIYSDGAPRSRSVPCGDCVSPVGCIRPSGNHNMQNIIIARNGCCYTDCGGIIHFVQRLGVAATAHIRSLHTEMDASGLCPREKSHDGRRHETWMSMSLSFPLFPSLSFFPLFFLGFFGPPPLSSRSVHDATSRLLTFFLLGKDYLYLRGLIHVTSGSAREEGS